MSAEAMRTAVLDLGSNSFHVLVADLEDGTLSPSFREREMLHLGRAVALHGRIPHEARQAAVAAAGHLAGLARRTGAVETLAVATAALREAANGRDVIAELSAAAGTQVRLLSDRDEGRLTYLGVRGAVAVRDEPVLVLDLGGGSLELVVGEAEQVAFSASVPLGVSRLSALVAGDPLTSREIRILHQRVDQQLTPLLAPIQSRKPRTAVAVGGTIRALARLVAARNGTWLPATLNQLTLDARRLAALTDLLVASRIEERRKLPAMKDRRADHIHVGAVVLSRVLERLDLASVTVSDWGLREGVLLDARGLGAPATATELRSREVARVRQTFRPDDPHPAHVAMLAGQLFDGTRQLHGLGDLDRELLGHAAALHAIGEALALRRQHLHGAYLVENAELRGFSPTEAAMLTTMVRFHRSRGINPGYAPYASLPAADRKRTERLLALLQVADMLDMSHDQSVAGVEVARRDQQIVLTILGRGLHSTADGLSRRTRLFTRLFDAEVTVHDQVS